MFRLLLALAVCLTPGAALNVGPLSLARPVATVPRAALIVCEEKVKPKGAQGRKRKSYIERLKGPSKGFLGRNIRVCKVPLLYIATALLGPGHLDSRFGAEALWTCERCGAFS